MAQRIETTEHARQLLRESDPGLLFVEVDVDRYIEESEHENGDDWFQEFVDSDELIKDFGDYLEATA